jgi:hypothetical protein
MSRVARSFGRLRILATAIVFPIALLPGSPARGDRASTIERIKVPVVAVGTFVRTRAPPSSFSEPASSWTMEC